MSESYSVRLGDEPVDHLTDAELSQAVYAELIALKEALHRAETAGMDECFLRLGKVLGGVMTMSARLGGRR